MKAGIAALALAAAMWAGPSFAHDLPKESAAEQNIIVVQAERSGAPMWTITTPRGAVILVGEIRQVPKATPWFPDRLEKAAAGADRVLLGIKPKFSPGDIFRLIFAGGKITKLPKGTTSADYLDEARLTRLAALEAEYDQDYERKSFLMTSFDLLSSRLGFTKKTGKDASDVVKRAARRAEVPSEPIGTVRGEDLLDDLAAAPPADHLPCLDAAMEATEQGADLIEQRGLDWRASDIQAVMANPLEIALGRCWPWSDQEVGGELREQWVAAIDSASAQNGVTLAVVPLRILAERDGVLDQLDRSGVDLAGPQWRGEDSTLTVIPAKAGI